jgi:tetratricopeptide (TPR) repeat protein
MIDQALKDKYPDKLMLNIEIGIFERRINKDPNNAEAYTQLAFFLEGLDEYDLRLALYTKAISLKPDLIRAYLGRSHLYSSFASKSPENAFLAIQDAQEVVRLGRERGDFSTDWMACDYLYALSCAYQSIGDLSAATEVQRSALQYANTKQARQNVLMRLEQLEVWLAEKDALSTKSTR